MALFSGPENYATLTAPFKKMAEKLINYISLQESYVTRFEIEKAHIDTEIKISKTEIAKSEFTVTKISEMVVLDFDENGIADVDELPDNEFVDDSTPNDDE